MADSRGRLSGSHQEEFQEDEVLDPRIQVELERLNRASEDINRLELELDDARAAFRQTLSDTTHKLDVLARKLGTCVDKARPYYDARLKSKEAQQETSKAAYKYERACSMHEAAKEMVQLAEQGYLQREEPSDPAWQEMMNHATMKVNDAERERMENEKEHLKTMKYYKECDDKVQRLQKELKRAINKSKPYFEMKAKFNQMMEEQKNKIGQLEQKVNSTKSMYSEALQNLECISDAIHRQRMESKRNLELGVRGAGVGSESPSPPHTREDKLDGSSDKFIGSCSASGSQMMVTTTVSNGNSSQSFYPPSSVIYSSPEKARRQSYRDAIEKSRSRLSSELSLDVNSISEENRIDLDEEYVFLPGDPLGVTKRFSTKRLSTRLSEESPNIAYLSNTQTPQSSTQTSQSSNQTLQSSTRSSQSNTHGMAKPVDIPSVVDGTNSGEANQLTGSPSGSRKVAKLQGLILKVDSGLDQLQVQMGRATQPVPSKQEVEPELQVMPYPLAQNFKKQLDDSSLENNTQNMSVKKTFEPRNQVSNILSPTDQQESKSLRVPSRSDFDDSPFSDNESISSATMLDDNQLELLTLQFNDQSVDDNNEDKASSSVNRNSWNLRSLPPKLSYLEQYIKTLDKNQAVDNDEEEDNQKEEENQASESDEDQLDSAAELEEKSC
ncbi:hypothetical protein CHS0354_043162 [Potamilus streckersoni]|uniref:SH3 domain-binding protein 5 n=1 Tax=Potamilus streckersoni TaxID=2493646 RepID=A0AAE0VZS6_9BIVA|nr:hypothetical protein CHS0354_043162 [Potamilus streckersoni]